MIKASVIAIVLLLAPFQLAACTNFPEESHEVKPVIPRFEPRRPKMGDFSAVKEKSGYTTCLSSGTVFPSTCMPKRRCIKILWFRTCLPS